MTPEDFLRKKNIWILTKVADNNAPENYIQLCDLLEQYHQSKSLPRPIEAWKAAREKDIGDYCEWFLEQEKR